ncbi:hypothetical protein [Nocardia sp. GAS34]|uniref:hypothetical protein n=1 Tax=unclassified Nocardia TaxID=2637762 RepID=UPI003D25750B
MTRVATCMAASSAAAAGAPINVAAVASACANWIAKITNAAMIVYLVCSISAAPSSSSLASASAVLINPGNSPLSPAIFVQKSLMASWVLPADKACNAALTT